MAARQHQHRTVFERAIVEHDPDRRQVVIGMRIEGPILVPFDRRAVAGRLHVELAGVEPHRAPQILQRCNDLRMRAARAYSGSKRWGVLIRRPRGAAGA